MFTLLLKIIFWLDLCSSVIVIEKKESIALKNTLFLSFPTDLLDNQACQKLLKAFSNTCLTNWWEQLLLLIKLCMRALKLKDFYFCFITGEILVKNWQQDFSRILEQPFLIRKILLYFCGFMSCILDIFCIFVSLGLMVTWK